MSALAAQVRAPGVYVEWLDANPQALEPTRTDVAGFLGVAERGPLHTACKIESMRQFVTTFGAHIADGCLAYAVEGFFANGGRLCWVVRVADPAAARTARIALIVPGQGTITLEAVSSGNWGNSIHIVPVWERDAIVALMATSDGRPSQTLAFDTSAPPNERAGAIKLANPPDRAASELAQDVLVVQGDPSPRDEVHDLGSGRALSGGDDGSGSTTPAHYYGGPDDAPWGMDALSRVDGISFVAAPDLMFARGFDSAAVRDAQIAILSRCVARKDRIALLDLPPTHQPEAIRYVSLAPDSTSGLTSTSYAAVYHPWIMVDDPLRLAGNVRMIPPSGHVAGMIARTDRRRGVHKAPANEVLEGVWDLYESIDDHAHALLNETHINAIRAIPGRGIRVLGARTLDLAQPWCYINVRRLFAMIQESLEEQMQWLVFEPNNPRLWREVDRAVRGFLERLFRAGMLDGATSEDAYFVRCDETSNPREQTDDGRVMCELGLQPPWPAEFVVVRIGITRNGIQIEERGAQDV